MGLEVTMPQLGESVTEGTIGSWLKRAGDRIERDEPLVEVISDKVNAEIPSPVAGVLVEILVPEGETVPVGQPIALIEPVEAGVANGTGAGHTTVTAATAPAVTAATEGSAVPGTRVASGSGEGVVVDAASARIGRDEERPRRYSPVVRRLAQEYGVDLTRIVGTGYSGRVTKRDVLAYIEAEGRNGPVSAVAAAPGHGASGVTGVVDSVDGDREVHRPNAVRRTIASRLVQAWREIPHVWAVVEADVTGLVRLRERWKDEFRRREGVPLTYVPFWIKAVVQSLREEPMLNAVWEDGKIVVQRRIHVGLAVGVEHGLVVPVIRDADGHTIASLAREVHRLAEKARAGRLGVDDVRGSTITLNNTGALGVVLSKSIVNPPHTAICNMDAIVRRPVVVGDAIAIRSMVNLTISFDHRVVDGVPVGRFLQAMKARMESYDETTSLY